MKINEHYYFKVTERTHPDYRMASSISQWIQSNLENLKDDDNHKLFNKVNLGYSEDNLKHFGKKPVCDVHLGTIEYSNDFQDRTPNKAHSTLIFYFKGANDMAYLKCCEIHDYLLQEFITNESFKVLDDVVLDTYILNSELMNQPVNKKWGVMGGLELVHLLY